MKHTIITIMLAMAAILPAAAQKKVQPRYNTGVGPVEAISTDFRSLPPNAQTFVNELFPATTVASVTNDVADREYEVKMSDGYEITFDYNGNWIAVDTPDNVMLPSSVLNRLVPENVVVETLSGDKVVPGGVVNYIEEIAYIPNYGYVVEYETTTNEGKVGIDKSGNILKQKPSKAKFDKQKKGKKSSSCCKGKKNKPHDRKHRR